MWSSGRGSFLFVVMRMIGFVIRLMSWKNNVVRLIERRRRIYN